MSNQKLTLEELQKRGGEAFKKKYGKAGFAELGRKGHEARMAKYGVDYYSRIGKISAEKRRARALLEKPKKTARELLMESLGIKR